MVAHEGSPERTQPLAYSYLRFSSPQQTWGDSRRRQTELAEKYAISHGLQLDHSLNFRDLGVSAFRSENSRVGGLRSFLDAVEHGYIARGSYLLIESLDRLTRDQIVAAQSLFLQIIQAGIRLVTLVDQRVYSEELINENPHELIISLVTMMRANEESTTKALRNRAAWSAKRARASNEPMTAQCPGWLELDRNAGRFKILKPQAAVVRRIFGDYLKGYSQLAITQALNREKIPLFGGRRRPGRHWHRAYVGHLLTWPAVIGLFTPHITHHVDGRIELQPQQTIADYYPSIIKPADFKLVQSLRAERQTAMLASKGSVRSPSIFAYLAKCPRCGATMTRTSSSDPNWRYLTCTAAMSGADCVRRSVRYPELEHSIVAGIDSVIRSCPKPRMTVVASQIRLSAIRERLKGLRATRRTIAAQLEALRRARAAGVSRLKEVDDVIARLTNERKLLRAGSRDIDDPSLHLALARLSVIAKGIPLIHTELNGMLRRLLSAITVRYDESVMELHWKHGGSSILNYDATQFMRRLGKPAQQ